MHDVSQVSLGDEHTCAIKKDGTLWCWGNNSYGQPGNGNYQNQLTPQMIMNDILQVDLGYDHTCAIKKDNSLWCWGRNDGGQI